MATTLPRSEYRTRLSVVRDRLGETDADAAVWFDATNIQYLTGFHHIQTERPVALVVTEDVCGIAVPRLEVERVTPNPHIDTVVDYFDYPGGAPIETAVELLSELDVSSVVADSDGAPATMGYEGPALSAFLDVERQGWVDRMRWSKSEPEIELLRESAKWANLGHRWLTEHIEPGAHPATVSQRASMNASRAMLDALGERYVACVRGDGPVSVGFISGPQTALPHGYTANRRLRDGDVLITGATAVVDGYRSELERTMFVGEPTDEQAHYFRLMLEAQSIALDALEPGVSIAAVDRAVWDYFEEQGVTDLARHHVGHNIGLGAHEPPYIDRGWDHPNDTIQPGHVYTIEPGLYTDTAGYRHSDTVVITDTDTERLTYFPRSLRDNVITASESNRYRTTPADR